MYRRAVDATAARTRPVFGQRHTNRHKLWKEKEYVGQLLIFDEIELVSIVAVNGRELVHIGSILLLLRRKAMLAPVQVESKNALETATTQEVWGHRLPTMLLRLPSMLLWYDTKEFCPSHEILDHTQVLYLQQQQREKTRIYAGCGKIKI